MWCNLSFGDTGVATLTFYLQTTWNLNVKFNAPLDLPQEGTLGFTVKEAVWA